MDLRQSNQIRTEILHILISCHGQCATLLATTGTSASTESLVDNNSVSCSRCNKSGAIREASPAGIKVEGQIGKAIAERAEE